MARICSSDFMSGVLSHFSKEEVLKWYRIVVGVDKILSNEISKNLNTFLQNKNQITPELAKDFSEILKNEIGNLDYDPNFIEAYYGYTVYGFPDFKQKNVEMNKPDVYYGIAKTDSFGVAHIHKLSDAFNYILDGEGIFTGINDDKNKFPNYYHGTKMIKDVEFEIPIGMTHGHLVKKGSTIWFFFVQECGFKPNLKCAGDFYKTKDYNKEQFGPYYI